MSDGGGFGRDSGTPRRRMLPAVTDVVRDLARTVSADPAVLFKAARSVVADELARVKQGFESAPLDVLVRRAHRQLEKEGVATPLVEPGQPDEPKSVSIPAPPLKPKEKKAPPAGEGPFQSAGAADLDWEKDLNIQADDAPFRSAILPLPPRSRVHGILPRETAVPPPAPAQPAPPPPSSSRLPVPERVTAPEGLAVERSGGAPIPKSPIEDLPLFSASEPPLEPPTLAPPPPPPPPAPEPPPVREEPSFVAPEPVVEAPAPRLEPPTPRFEPPAPRFEPPRSRVEPSAPRPEPEPRFETPPPPFEEPGPRFEPPAPRWQAPAARVEPRVKSMPEMPPLASVVGEQTEPVEPEMREFSFKAAEAPEPPKKSGRTGWIAAVVVVLAVAAGLVWVVRTFLSGDVVKKVEAPPPAPAPAKKHVEAAPVPPPAANTAAAPAKATPAPKAAGAPVAVPKGKAAPLVTPDWSGKPTVYVVHFSSHKDRPSAEKEARRLAGELGKPGRAVEVDLGDKGVWYRVVIGEFANVDEARAWRADLEAKKTPGLGFVYEMRGR